MSIFDLSKKTSMMMYSERLAKILFHLSLFFTLLTVISALTKVATVFVLIIYWAVAIVILIFYLMLIIITLGTILITSPDFFSKISHGSDIIISFAESKFAYIWRYIAPVGLVLAAFAIVFFILDRRKKHLGRVITCGIFAVIGIVTTVWGAILLAQ